MGFLQRRNALPPAAPLSAQPQQLLVGVARAALTERLSLATVRLIFDRLLQVGGVHASITSSAHDLFSSLGLYWWLHVGAVLLCICVVCHMHEAHHRCSVLFVRDQQWHVDLLLTCGLLVRLHCRLTQMLWPEQQPAAAAAVPQAQQQQPAPPQQQRLHQLRLLLPLAAALLLLQQQACRCRCWLCLQ